MRNMRWVAVLLLMPLNSGCAFYFLHQQMTAADITRTKVVSESVARVGELVSFSQLDGTVQRQVAFRCNTDETWLLYTDLGRRRIYPAGGARYTQAGRQRIDFERGQPELVAACERRQDLRLLSEEKGGVQVLLDRATVQSTGNGLRRVWAAFDYPTVAHDLPYQAPFGQKREHLQIDCSRATVTVLVGYDVDPDDMVTDGKVFSEATPEVAIGDYKTVADAVCGPPGALSAQPNWVRRHKVVIPALR